MYIIFPTMQPIAFLNSLNSTCLIKALIFQAPFWSTGSLLKEYFTDLALHSCNIVWLTMDSLKKRFKIHAPTMQLDHQQFGQRFRCVIVVAANRALIR